MFDMNDRAMEIGPSKDYAGKLDLTVETGPSMAHRVPMSPWDMAKLANLLIKTLAGEDPDWVPARDYTEVGQGTSVRIIHRGGILEGTVDGWAGENDEFLDVFQSGMPRATSMVRVHQDDVQMIFIGDWERAS